MGVTLPITMKIITLFLCALAHQVASETNDIFPAKILTQQKSLSENSDLYVICSTFGLKKQTEVYVYLCRNDVGMIKHIQKKEHNDTTFIINRVSLNHSGNYSCVYSTRGYSPPEVTKKACNPIEILVIANFLPADISVAGPLAVSEGDDVEFSCTVSETLQTLGGCQLIHSYLKRNELILQVQTFNVTQMEATFTIQDAVTRDSGNYSCVVLPSKCIQKHEKTLYGNNAVSLEVKESLFLRVIVSCGVISMMITLGLCLWCINKPGGLALCNQRAPSEQANIDMLEEQQEQTEEGLEAQDGDSFSTEEEEGYQNVVNAEDSTYSDGLEGVYSVADDSENDYDDSDHMCAN
ncbi:uncharacterized protein LOC127351813 isoform X2 [Dicentrarchus labrax]|uniref:uncharacterized protein LOC127351813 isoform X2 n=1 Tax=Dicentrarchus labrax TaxID=13489 RepID=UPI0021F5C0D0|nr:uncharacterized protein LOC127351813 isoform X2 [Dicentrarchus labrax]XP_051235721.1 uncharacterized protein LOC127351813 isoform X2 [Dicentrarchus labrax]